MDGIKISQGLGLQDFDLIRVIGRGSYAKVLLVRLKKNDQVYAMKVVKKELVHDDEVSPAPGLRPLPLHGGHTPQCRLSSVDMAMAFSAFAMCCRHLDPAPGPSHPPEGDPAPPAVTLSERACSGRFPSAEPHCVAWSVCCHRAPCVQGPPPGVREITPACGLSCPPWMDSWAAAIFGLL